MKKSTIILLIFLIMIMCVSAVSAADDASDDLAASDEDAVSVSNDDIVSASDSNTVLSAGEANFGELKGNITDKSGNVELSSDFKRNSTEDFSIAVNNNLVINGNGKTIDNNGCATATIFTIVSGKNVTLKNMTLINADIAVENGGNLTLDHVTFTGCKVTSVSGSQLTVSDSTFGDRDIVLEDGAQLLSQAQIIVEASPETILTTTTTTSELSAEAYVNGKKIVVNSTKWKYFEGSTQITTPSAYSPSILGTHEIKATHDALVNAVCTNATVNVTAGSTLESIITIDVIPVNPVYNNTVVIKVTVNNYTGHLGEATPTGDVEFTINSESFGPLTLVNGTANYTISNAAVKEYSVYAKYLGDDNFKINSTVVLFNVEAKTPAINIDVDTTKFQDQTITITLPGDATGSVTVEINDNVVVENGVLVAGVYSFNTAYLVNATPYTINVTFTSTNSNYTNNKNSTTFKVDRFTTPINITLGKYKYNEDVSFDIELASDITGDNVNVTVKNAAGIIFNENITLTNGKATVDLGKIAAGNYDINVTFEGNTKYAPAVNDTVKLFVNKTAPIITVVSIDNQVLFEDVEINVTVQNATKGTAIKLYVNNVENATATVDENGTATFKCKFVESAGTFPITVKYMGDNNLTEGNITDNVVLAKVTPEINASVGVVYIGSNAVISVNLTNCDTNYYPLGVIQYVLGGYSGTVSLVNGKIDITIPKENLDQVTSYTVTISYLKDASEKRYNDNSTEFTFDVVKYTPSIKVDANNNVVTENATIDVEFTSDNLAGDVTVTVVIKSDGAEPTTKNLVLKYQSADKKANGTLSIKLPLGTQSVNVTFAENTTTYSAYNDTCTFEVTKDKPVIDMNITNKTDVITEIAYPNQATVNFTSNVDGDYKLYVNDQLVNSGSFVAGKISNFTLPRYVVGDYTVNLTYVANGEYNETTITKTFKVKNGTITVSDVTALVVKYPNVTVVFIEANVDGDYNITVNNKNYTVTVKDGEGNKTLHVLDAGKYNVDLLSLVEYYDTVKTTYTNVVDIQKGDIYFNVTVANVAYPNKAIAIVEASVGGNFTVTVNNKNYTVTVKDGKGNVTLDVLPVNKYDVTVQANASDASFNNWDISGTNTTKFNVTNGTLAPTITVNSSVKYEDVIVVNITNAVDGTYNVNVNGTDYPIDVLNGNGSTTIPTKNTLNVGTYTVNVTSTISNYNPFEDATHTVTVEKGIIYFNIAVDNVTFPTVPTVKFVTNVDGSLNDAYLIYIGDENITYVKANGDTQQLSMYKFTPGNYTIYVKPSNATDPKFANYDINTVNSTSFEVAYGKIDTLTVSVNNVDYPQNATITVKASVDGIYKVTIEGQNIEIPIVITGAAPGTPVTNNTVYLPVLPVGKYTVNVTSLNENYTETTNGSTFTVSNGTINPAITITPNPVAYSDAVVIEISNAVDGNYTVKINGTDYTVTVKDGKGNKTIETFNKLYAGSYNVNVTALIDNYNPFEDASKTLTVNKGTIHLNITVAGVTYPNVATAVVFADMPGEYNITVYASQGGAELYNYTVTITTTPGQVANNSQTIGLLNASDDYYIVVKSCDENYTGATNNTSFKVEKAVPVINISHEGDTLFANTTISVVVPYGTGKVTFYDKVIGPGYKLGEKVLVNNAANWTIENITVGTHTIYVVLSDDQNLQDEVNSTSFTIEKITPTITVTDNSTTYPDAVEIVVVLQNNGTTYAPTGSVGITGDIQVAPGTLVDGKYTFTVAGLAAGEYKINVTYYPNTDKNYTTNVKEYTFIIAKATPKITINDVKGATYPENATINFTNDVAGDIIIVCEGDKNYTFNLGALEANDHVVNLSGLDAGVYKVTVTYSENQNYTSVSANDTVTIAQFTPIVEVEVVNATYPNNGTVRVKSNINGTYIVAVLDNNNNTVDIHTGNFTAGEFVNITLCQIAAGDYKVNVTYVGNNDYKNVTEQADLKISKGTPVISIVTVNSTFPNRALVNFTSDVEGDFNFTIGDVEGNGTFINGNLTIELTYFGAVGTYPVTLTYKENENYTSVPETGSLTIEKGTAEINITVDTITALEDATLTVNIPYATGNFTLYGTSLPTAGIVIELTDGVATYNIGKLNPGNYSYVVEYSGDHNLSGDVEAFTFTVDRLDPNLQITSADYTWGDKGVVNITIDNKDELTVSISIDGKVVEEFFKVTNGSAQYALPELAVGKYDIIVSYAGSEMYNASSQIIENLTVSQLTPTIVVPDVTLTYPETGSFVISTNVANMELKVKIGDEDPILITTDENGNATANIKLVFEAGNYTISVSNVANENISAVTSNATLTVNKANINLTVTGPVNVTYPENVTFTIKTDVAGNYTIDINGDSKVYEIAAGESIISGLANAGPCTIVVTSVDPNYETATATFTTTVLPGTIDITIDAPASAFDQPHTIIITTTVAGNYSINVAGKETNATLNKGEFVVPPSYMPDVLEAGNYTITVTSLDPNYKASANATLEVTKAAAKVNITDNADEIMVGDDFTFTVTMSDNFANGNVTIYVDGKEYQTVLLDYAYANATVTISGLTAYYHVIDVKYNGNNNYNPSENTTVDVDVYKYTPVITVSVKNATSLAAIAATEATITVTGVKGKATGEITVDYENGTSVTYNLTDGVYVLELYDLTAGTHSIPVYYLGDDIYSYEYTDINFTVAKGTSVPEISDVTTPIKYGDDATFTVTMSDNFANGNVTLYLNGEAKEIIALDDDYANASVTLAGLTPGNYTIGIKYNGNDNFLASEVITAKLVVEKATPAIAIAFADENLTAIAGTTITVTVADGKATGDVKVSAAGFTKEGTLENGTITLEIYDVVAGDYTVEVTYYGDDNYVKTTANKTFTVAKRDVTPVISEPTSVILVGQNATFIVTMDQNFANGNITVNVDNGKYVYDLALDDQYANVSVYIPGLAAGTHVIGVKYNGNENCNPSEFVNTTVVVNKNDVSKLIGVSAVDGVYKVQSAKVVIELPGDAKGNVTISIVGLDNITAEIAGNTIVDMDIALPAGTYGLVQVVYSGDDKYLPYTTQGLLPEFVVNKANATVSIGDIAAATYPGSVNITYAVTPAFLNATVTVTDAKGKVVKAEVADNKVILTDLAAGAYTITVFTPGDDNYNNATASKAFSVAKADPTFTTVAAVNVTVGQNMTITVIAPEDATGTVYATVSGELVATGIPLVNGTATIVVPNLAYGKYGYAVTYEGDDNYNLATDINSFEIIKKDISGNVTIDIPAGASTYEPTFAIKNLPSDATGTLTVTVDGKEYLAEVKNGGASITIPGLSVGNHNVTVTYSGDAQYGNISKSDMITLITPVPKLEGKDLSVLYSGSAKYTVLLTIDGKPAAGEIVSVSFNGAKLSVKTNSKGEATFKLNSKAKIDKYDVTAKYSSAETTNKVTIKNIIKAKNKKVKKSKTTKVKITLSKVDGKYLKGKKLKIKLKGKKYKVKTNKKGKATWKVKPSMIKKLKVGKKYKYTVSYGKDTVTKKLKIKR